MFAKQRSFFSALMAAALTFALSFSGAVFDSPLGTAPAAEALSPCPTGWTFIVTAGPYKDYCYNQITSASAARNGLPHGGTGSGWIAIARAIKLPLPQSRCGLPNRLA
mgnify:CR=1 FL=1